MQKQSFLFLLILVGMALLAVYQAFVPAPGGAPQVAIRFLGLVGFFLLCVSLIIGPLAVLWPQKFAQLIEPRRAVGVSAFIFSALHFSLVLSLYFKFDFGSILSLLPLAIALPPYIIMLAMALTSNDWATNKLGMAKWKMLHRLVYVTFALTFAHFVLSANSLFPKEGSQAPINLAEVALLLLGGVVIVLQIAGFLTFRKRQSASKAAATNTNAPNQG
ncbi:MAG: ferric reductase-like transmembrane domain-containing protein [Candidatus Anstonellaceae archaeon]